MFSYVMVFIFGCALGSFISLLMAAAGKNNHERDYYQEGYQDGYRAGKTAS